MNPSIRCTYQTRPADPPALLWLGRSRPASLQHSYICLLGAGSLARVKKGREIKLPKTRQ